MGASSKTFSFLGYPPTTGNMVSGDGSKACKFTIAVPESEVMKAMEAYLGIPADTAFLVTITPVSLSPEDDAPGDIVRL